MLVEEPEVGRADQEQTELGLLGRVIRRRKMIRVSTERSSNRLIKGRHRRITGLCRSRERRWLVSTLILCLADALTLLEWISRKQAHGTSPLV